MCLVSCMCQLETGKIQNFTKNLLDTLGRRVGSRRAWRRLEGIRQWLGLMAHAVPTGVGSAHKTAEHGSIQVTESGPGSVPARVESSPRRLRSALRRVGGRGRLAAGAATTSSWLWRMYCVEGHGGAWYEPGR